LVFCKPVVILGSIAISSSIVFGQVVGIRSPNNVILQLNVVAVEVLSKDI
jgi:hypothetical protein